MEELIGKLAGGAHTVWHMRLLGMSAAAVGAVGLLCGMFLLMSHKDGRSGMPHFTVILLSLSLMAGGVWTWYYTQPAEVPGSTSMRDFLDGKHARTTWEEAMEKGYDFRVDMKLRDPETLDKDVYEYTVSDEERTVFATAKTGGTGGWRYLLVAVPLLFVLLLMAKS